MRDASITEAVSNRMKHPRRQPPAATTARPGEEFVWEALLIFACAFAVRLIHIWQIRRAPFFGVLMGDARGYDAWGQRIANGDWLGHEVFYQAPLYPYFLGASYTIAGRGLPRENAMVLVGVILLWASVRKEPAPFIEAATFLVGLAIVLAPVAIRNHAVGGGFYLTTSQFGPNFYIGNNPRSDGTYMSLRYGRGAPEYERQDAAELAEEAMGRRLTPSEV